MDSVEIISRKCSSVELDMNILLSVCIARQLSFTVTFSDEWQTPQIFIYSHKPYLDEFTDDDFPRVTVHIIPNGKREDKNKQFPQDGDPYLWVMALTCREKQFMLPLIIDLLVADPTWRLWNVEGLVMDVERLKRAYDEQDYTWAYMKE